MSPLLSRPIKMNSGRDSQVARKSTEAAEQPNEQDDRERYANKPKKQAATHVCLHNLNNLMGEDEDSSDQYPYSCSCAAVQCARPPSLPGVTSAFGVSDTGLHMIGRIPEWPQCFSLLVPVQWVNHLPPRGFMEPDDRLIVVKEPEFQAAQYAAFLTFVAKEDAHGYYHASHHCTYHSAA